MSPGLSISDFADSSRHNDPESLGHYRHEPSLSQVSMAESNPAHTIVATTVPPLSPNMLEPATQQSSAMSIYSIVDHNTPRGFVHPPMDTFNDHAPIGPYGFPPELVYGANSDESAIYSSDSCYSPNPEYSHARIAGQSYQLRHNSQHSQSLTPYMGPGYKSPLYLTSTLPAWCETETSPNEDSGTNLSSESLKLGPDTAWNSVTSIKATTSTSAEPQRRHTTSRSSEQSHHMNHGPPNQQSPSTSPLQTLLPHCDPPRKRRREYFSMTTAHSASSENPDELPLCFDASLIHGVNNIVNKKAETNEKAEALGAAEEAQRSDPAQAVNHLLRKWTTLFDMPFAPSWDSGRQSAVL